MHYQHPELEVVRAALDYEARPMPLKGGCERKGRNISCWTSAVLAWVRQVDVPLPIEDYPGKGGAVQMHRMITMESPFTDPGNNPISGTTCLQFIHSVNRFSLSQYATYTFGYVSQKLLDAIKFTEEFRLKGILAGVVRDLDAAAAAGAHSR